MRKKNLLTLVIVFAAVGAIYAQTGQPEKTKQLPSVAIGAGVLSFNGDIGSGVNLSSFSRIKGGYNIMNEQRIGKFLGIALNGVYGKLADRERTKTSQFNFQCKKI